MCCFYQVCFWELNQYARIQSLASLRIWGTSIPSAQSLLSCCRGHRCHVPQSAEYKCEFEELIWGLGELLTGWQLQLQTPHLTEARCWQQLLTLHVSLSNSGLAECTCDKISVGLMRVKLGNCGPEKQCRDCERVSDGLMQLMISCFFLDSNVLSLKSISPCIKKICSVLQLKTACTVASAWLSLVSKFYFQNCD